MSDPTTFRSAMREYAPVGIGLAFADIVVALWLVWDYRGTHAVVAGLFAFSTVVLWLMTLAITVTFAAKEVWLSRQFAKRRAPSGEAR